jgi:hypothetical protein
MNGFIWRTITALCRRALLWGALLLIILSALRVATRQGRHAAEAEFAIRAAEARIRALRTSREVRHDIETVPDALRDHRLDRWMRD